ncbi:energy transducer TonB [Chromobacterium piscinae]|uniref:energy transducer TonB n=1 Tax=Chromobacterium piscinae TaxID=686831 RepID=UPI003F7D1E28
MKTNKILPIFLVALISACASTEPQYSIEKNYNFNESTPQFGKDQFQKNLAARMSKMDFQKNYDTPLILVKADPPEYPQALQDAEISGLVQFYYSVEVDGHVGKVEIHRSPNPALADIIRKTVYKWKFISPTKYGFPTRLIVRDQFEFNLR